MSLRYINIVSSLLKLMSFAKTYKREKNFPLIVGIYKEFLKETPFEKSLLEADETTVRPTASQEIKLSFKKSLQNQFKDGDRE